MKSVNRKSAALMLAPVMAGTFLLAGCGTQPSASASTGQKVTLTIETGGDVNVRNLFQDKLDPMYQKSHPNVSFQLLMPETSAAGNALTARFFAAVQHHKSAPFDIGDVGAEHHDDLPLTVANLPNLSRVDQSVVATQGYGDSVQYRASSVVLAYNSHDVKTPPKTLSQLIEWIKKNPGEFTYCPPDDGGSGDAFVQAVLSQFIPKSDITKMDTNYYPQLETTWSKGFQELKSLNADMYQHGVYPNGNTPVMNLLANGSIEIAPVWSDMSMQALGDGQMPSYIKLVQIKPPFYGGYDFMGIPKNSPNKKAALSFLNFMLSSPAQNVIVDYMNGYPGVKWQYVSPSIKKRFSGIDKAYGLGFYSKMDSDMASLWQKNVPQS